MSDENEKYNVTVLSRSEIKTFPKLGEAVITVLVTYVAAGLPPHTVRILKSMYNTESERTVIRASIKDRLTKKPESYRV